jgi:hypothetical protein
MFLVKPALDNHSVDHAAVCYPLGKSPLSRLPPQLPYNTREFVVKVRSSSRIGKRFAVVLARPS